MNRRITELHRAATRTPGVICLAGGLPADELLPRAALATACGEAASDAEALQYGWPEGHARVRRWISQRLACRGARVDPAHVIVTAGAQQALMLIARSLPGVRIGVGDATYAGALDAFRASGATIGRTGDVDYAISGIANPKGVDLVDRYALLASGRPIIADEAYVELRFDGHLGRPLIADAPGRVWHVGTISKTISPGLRLGWLIPPVAMHDAVLELKHASDLHASSVSQAAFARLLELASYDRVVEQARAEYASRAARCIEALARHVPHARFAEPEGGMSVWLETDDTGDDIMLLATALAYGVVFDPGSLFRPEPSVRIAMRLSFSSTPACRLEEGARRLGRALAHWRHEQPVRLPPRHRSRHPPLPDDLRVGADSSHMPRDLETTGVVPVLQTERATTRGAIKPTLVCVSGAELGRSFSIGPADMIVGRGRVDITLADRDVSRRHARLFLKRGAFRIEDLESSNGTFVNGQRITGAVPVGLGDRIQIGRTVLVFTVQDELEQRVAAMMRLESMATLAGGIAHDFNNALAVVMCNLDLVEPAISRDAVEALEGLEQMRRATRSATVLARQLLGLGRSEPQPFETVSVAAIAKETIAMARRRARGRVSTAVDVPANLDVIGAPEELRQVLLNLSFNSCDAMKQGGNLGISARVVVLDVDAALACQVPVPGEYVEISVSDTGHGMDRATLERAFEPFFTTKSREEGTGLGLAMVHATVRRHGGAVEVTSHVGQGTTFRILLPRSPEATDVVFARA